MRKSKDDTDIESRLRALSWSINGRNRTIVFNLLVPAVRNNIDMCLLNCSAEELTAQVCKTPERYLALGELKGGIDPAAADERWKTARAALSRIRSSFSSYELSPYTFFVGAAIAKKMATEIWEQLESGALTNAANLTDADQVASFCRWLVEL